MVPAIHITLYIVLILFLGKTCFSHPNSIHFPNQAEINADTSLANTYFAKAKQLKKEARFNSSNFYYEKSY